LEGYKFKIDGIALKEGVPIPLAISALDSFQSILDKTYLVSIGKERITVQERKKFFLLATEFEQGSLLTHFDIAMQGVQLGLPMLSAFGPQNIWDYTKDTFGFLKTVCESVQKGVEPKYTFNNEGDVDLHIGDVHHHYHAPVVQIGKLALPNYQTLAHLIDSTKLDEISAGPCSHSEPDIFMGKDDKNMFDIPTKIEKDTIDIKCEVFDFNKYQNAGKLAVKIPGQHVPEGIYNFSIFGTQDNVDYIYSMLKPEVVLTCLMEIALSPFGGQDIHKLHITGVGS